MATVTLSVDVRAIDPFREQQVDPFHVEGLKSFEDAMERAAQALHVGRLIRAGMESAEFEDAEGIREHALLQAALWTAEHCLDAAMQIHNDRLIDALRDDKVVRIKPKDGA